MENSNSLKPVLTLFDAPAENGGAPEALPAKENQAASPVKTGTGHRGKKSGGLDGVVYGKQASAADAAKTPENTGSDAGSTGEKPKTQTLDERRAHFRELVDGDYKDIYRTEIQRIIDRRFKETKTLQESIQAQKPILDSLFERYKISDGDLQKLSKALDEDSTYWEKAAREAGMGVEQYKKLQSLQRENKALLDNVRRGQQKQSYDRQMTRWQQEAGQAMRAYPGMNLKKEMRNPRFASMLRSGIPIQHAYEVVHLDDIKTGVARQTAKKTERNVVEGIRTRGNRPAENGVTAQSGVIVKSDVSKLTKADRAEIIRRVARGEKISF